MKPDMHRKRQTKVSLTQRGLVVGATEFPRKVLAGGPPVNVWNKVTCQLKGRSRGSHECGQSLRDPSEPSPGILYGSVVPNTPQDMS